MAREVMAIRVDRGLRSRLRAAARRRGLSPSAATRVALEEWLAAEEASGEARPYEAIADLVGSVRARRRR